MDGKCVFLVILYGFGVDNEICFWQFFVSICSSDVWGELIGDLYAMGCTMYTYYEEVAHEMRMYRRRNGGKVLNANHRKFFNSI